MTPMATFFLFFLSSLFFFSIAREDRAPHGIAYENPMAFSPSAFEFFHPNIPCIESDCAPLPLVAVLQASQEHGSKLSTPQTSGRRVGAGGVVGIVFGFVCAVLLAMVVYYVGITRRVNMNQANSVRPDA
ncbi:hypothetical protein HHK36_018200 [Tetracentron sinense]|uniref:Uncharacterized protein n=1 Tax=Tetracentron sinense TaxID=13715 RepID=A0A834Z3G4_TETSI|nr:hypothetical protein HHK36_018200 [Tetracentron sinense]